MVSVLDNGKRLRVRLPAIGEGIREREPRPFPEEIEVLRQGKDGQYGPPMIFVPRDGSDG